MTDQPTDTETITAQELAHAIDNSTPYPIELDSTLCAFMAERLLEMLTVAKRPEHAVWQPEEPPGPSPEPLDPESLAPVDDRLRCLQCGEDITDYAEDDHVFRTGDERPYCSGECVVAAHRAVPVVPVSSPPPDQTVEAPCVCSKPESPGTRHRSDGPCYAVDAQLRVAALAIARTEAHKWADGERLEDKPLWQTYLAHAVAVLAVLPPPADRAAVLLWAADAALTARIPFVSSTGRECVADWLRRLAAEAPQPDTGHSCSNCDGVDPDSCLMNPNRPPEQCPRSEFDGYGLQCQKPAGHNLCTFEEQPPPVHKGGNADDCPGTEARP